MTQRQKQQIFLLAVMTGSLLLPAPPAAAAPFGRPGPGAIIDQLPQGYRALRSGLFFHDGLFFRPAEHGFHIVRPPVGTIISDLPEGSIAVTIAGLDYFLYREIYYRPVPEGYRVVEKPVETVDVALAAPGDRIAVQPEWLNLRSGPGREYEVRQTLRKGTGLTVRVVADDWYFVQMEDGSTGWVMKRYVQLQKQSARG